MPSFSSNPGQLPFLRAEMPPPALSHARKRTKAAKTKKKRGGWISMFIAGAMMFTVSFSAALFYFNIEENLKGNLSGDESTRLASLPTGPVTGLPLNRFVSIGPNKDKANARVGPGTQFPILWVFQRPGLPLRVVDEYEDWRKVEDWQGEGGWVHRALLVKLASLRVNSSNTLLYRKAAPDAEPLARLEEGVIVRLQGRGCESGWCKVSVGNYKGFVRADQVWGGS